MTTTILIAEDEASQRFTCHELCKRFGYSVIEAKDGEEALYYLRRDESQQIGMLLTDLDMPERDGLSLIHAAREWRPDLPIVVITASDAVEDTVASMRAGAHDFITKPIEPERLRVSLQNALAHRSLRNEVVRLTRESKGQFRFADLIGAEGGLKHAITLAQKLAGSDLPVLITGESGVGKEAFARAIHGESRRAGQPFIAINCGAIPANLAESVLFGHEKGAFTGAVAKTLGKFREAQGGTLFLDEIGELPADTQVKLLRALQAKEIEPVGLGKAVAIDVRIISATHRDLNEAVEQQRFREDLFYRLNVLPLHLLPLRERPEDIPALIAYFTERLATKEGVVPRPLSPAAMQKLMEYHWPGNVRELENCMSRALLLAQGNEIGTEALEGLLRPATGKAPHATPPEEATQIMLLRDDGSTKTMEEIEREVIEKTLARTDHTVPKAAAMLEIGQSTLYRRIQEFRR